MVPGWYLLRLKGRLLIHDKGGHYNDGVDFCKKIEMEFTAWKAKL
jgi:hypothetical protein